MDKSEGRNFFSKTFSSVSEKVAKWYHTGNMKLSISSLKRARSEKIQALGNKIFDLMAQKKPVTSEKLQAEYNSIVELDEQIKIATIDLEKIQAEEKDEPLIPEKTKKSTTVKTAKTTKTPSAKKTGTEKKITAKKPAKRKTTAKSKVPAVKVENKPAVRKENKPAVKSPSEIQLKTEDNE